MTPENGGDLRRVVFLLRADEGYPGPAVAPQHDTDQTVTLAKYTLQAGGQIPPDSQGHANGSIPALDVGDEAVVFGIGMAAIDGVEVVQGVLNGATVGRWKLLEVGIEKIAKLVHGKPPWLVLIITKEVISA
jgi:hypothetical protein